MNAFDNNSALRPWEDKDEQAVKRKGGGGDAEGKEELYGGEKSQV